MSWVMFCEIFPHVLTYRFPINEKSIFFNPVLNPIKLHFHCLVPFLSNFSSDDAFGRVVVCFYWVLWLGKPISWCVTLRGTIVCPLWNSPLTYALAADATTCLRILHSVWIWRLFWIGWYWAEVIVPPSVAGMMHHCQNEVSHHYLFTG